MSQPVTNWDELSKEASRERRQGRRLYLTCPIEVRGMNGDGVAFTERAKTEEISETGCRIKTELPLNRGDVISIRLLVPNEQESENEPHLFEIIWTAFNSEGKYVGARKLDDTKFWKVTFPSSKSG